MTDHKPAIDESYQKFQDLEKQSYELSVIDYVNNRGLVEPGEPDKPIEPDPDFVIMENIGYKNGPNLQTEYGMHPLKIHYESAFFSDKKSQGAYQDLPAGTPYPLPNLNQVASVAASSPEISCIDIERYWNDHTNNGDEEIDDRAIVAYETIVDAYIDALKRDHKTGIYSTLPIRSYWPVINDKMEVWKETNNKFRDLAELLDYTFPSIYTFYTDSAQDQARHLKYAKAQVDEAKRIAPNAKCIPFVWPVFHSGNNDFKGKPIPKDYFRLQLDFCAEHADGVEIWTRSRTKNIDFADIPDWWEAVEEFVADMRG